MGVYQKCKHNGKKILDERANAQMQSHSSLCEDVYRKMRRKITKNYYYDHLRTCFFLSFF